MTPRTPRAVILAAFLSAMAAPARPQEIRFNVVPYRLDNGLRILILEDHALPVMSYYTFLRTGSRDERPGKTGISHLFEHMMFNGSKHFPPGEFDRTIESFGGSSDAFTTEDITVYYESFPSEALEKVVALEADRLAGLALTESSLATERDVVKEERRLSVDNDAQGEVLELLQGTAYLAHPYQWPVVGWMGDLDALTLADCQEYFRTHYAPGNATLILAGDFKPERAIDLIGKAYGSIPAQPPAAAVLRDEPEQRGERRAILRRSVGLPTVALAYHVPGTSSGDLFPLDLIQLILGAGESSLLNRRLVHEKEIATRVEVENRWLLDPSLFVVYAEGKPGGDPGALEAALEAEVEGLGGRDVTDGDLQKARNARTVSQVRALKTNAGKAEQLGMFEVYFGGYDRLFTSLKKYEAVTKADVRGAAARWLRPDNRTVVKVLPPIGDEAAHP